MIRVVGEPLWDGVTEKKVSVTKKRGRPRKANKLTAAEKQKAYRERRKGHE